MTFSEKSAMYTLFMPDVENSGIISQKLHMIVGISEKMLAMV